MEAGQSKGHLEEKVLPELSSGLWCFGQQENWADLAPACFLGEEDTSCSIGQS